MKEENLNSKGVYNEEIGADEKMEDNSIKTDEVEVIFKKIKQRLIDEINGADIIVGCVAWLTDFDILDSLSKKSVSIILQKEDFLRPDITSSSMWKSMLKQKYDSVNKNTINRQEIPGILNIMSTSSDPSIDCLRCVGNHNSDKKPAFPRMHNKFLIFCKHIPNKENPSHFGNIVPVKVWTGSFNFTKNAGMSLENAVIINNKKICEAYLNEYSQIAALSEPLDWDSEWIAPEWRIGT